MIPNCNIYLQNGGLDINGKGAHVKSIGTNGDCTNPVRNPSRMELDYTQQLSEGMHDSSGAYVNRIMLNGSAYSSPNLTNNRRDPLIQERAPGDGSLSNPDVIPSEKFPSINASDNTAVGIQGEGNGQNIQPKQNQGN